MDESKIPNSLLPHLNEIAERLWSGHAAIMVGAGFSKNANAIDDKAKSFPDWNCLGELFYEKARGRKVEDEKFLNPLKLADEVEASFDRPILHKLLVDSIPDKEYEPSDLHVKLLNLPWSDVFTTNYDTLLERATKSVSGYSYQTVVNAEGLVYSKSPRIIKLHGSFPDAKPFIITEEDYRRYPLEFAPFVNTVQQSLLENTLVLVGFSGDDPNFLRWIGWIRDNLGQGGSPNIYMVGILNLTKAQELLFLRNNIIPIDMSELGAVEKHDYYQALDEFLNFCLFKKGETDRLDWPESEDFQSPRYPNFQASTEENKELLKQEKIQAAKEQAEQVVVRWRGVRNQYPGWVVVPDDRRSVLWRATRYWDEYPRFSEDFSPILRLLFLFEYFWRIEKCLLPVFDDQIDAIKKAIEDFYPVINGGEKYSESMVIDLNRTGIESKDIREMVSFLTLALLRYFREEGQLEDWGLLYKKAEVIVSNSEDKAKLIYEYSLFSLFKFDIEKLKETLSRWESIGLTPYWLAKKAGLVAEVGDIASAFDMLEEALSDIRSKQNLKPIISDYSLVSQESFILVLLQYVNAGKAWVERSYRNNADYSESWNRLKQYKCDPWTELKLLERSVEGRPESKKSDDEEYQFDIGYRSNTMYFDSTDGNTFQAFRLLRFYEDAGIPHRIPGSYFSKNALGGVCKRLYEYSPYWVLSTVLRVGDKDLIQFVFSRRSLINMTFNDVNLLSRNYLDIYRKVSLGVGFRDSHYKSILDHSMPEVFSRLCTKVSFGIRREMLGMLLELYRSEYASDIDGVDKLVRRLVGSFSLCEFASVLPIIIDFPVFDADEYRLKHNFVNPLRFTSHLKSKYLRERVGVKIPSGKISKLIRYVSSGSAGERRWAIGSLMVLNRLKLINENQIAKFKEALWKRVDENGFPVETDYYRFALCSDLAVDEEKAHSLIRNYIIEEQLTVQANEPSQGVSITGSGYGLCYEIAGSSEYLSWSEFEITSIVSKLANCWALDKKYLVKDLKDSISDEFRKRFCSIQSAIVFLIFHHSDKFSEEVVMMMGGMLDEMSAAGLPSVRFGNAYSTLADTGIDRFECLRTGFLSRNRGDISDSVNAIYDLLYKRIQVSDSEVTLALGLVMAVLRYRDERRLIEAMWVVKLTVEDCPEYFSDALKDAALFCLDKLITETSKDGSTLPYSVSLEIREAAASLAYSLYRHFVNDEDEMPEVIARWKSICASEDEFSDIRKEWVF